MNGSKRDTPTGWERGFGLGLSLLFSAALAAQSPTLSIEATQINGTELSSGPSGHIITSPGDTFELKFFIRDWSPNGEVLRSYQITLDPAGFTSGPAGRVAPIGYDEHSGTHNRTNAFIDDSEADFVHKGLHIIPIVHALGTEYKWMNVVFETNAGPVSSQDGTKRSCGTVRMQVSDGARGEFTLSVFRDRELTLFNDPKNNRIAPLSIEPLVVEVLEASVWARIHASEPPSGSVDARFPSKQGESGWDQITLISAGDASSLSPGDFDIHDGTPDPPAISDLQVDGSRVTLRLNRGVPAGRWTVVRHRASGSRVRFGYLPGDVNGDGRTDMNDVTTLVEALNGEHQLRPYQADLDGDGAASAQDLAGLIRLLTDPKGRPGQIRE